MATLAVYVCVKRNLTTLVPFAVLGGFAVDFVIAYTISRIIS
jgi:hypothetical protein